LYLSNFICSGVLKLGAPVFFQDCDSKKQEKKTKHYLCAHTKKQPMASVSEVINNPAVRTHVYVIPPQLFLGFQTVLYSVALYILGSLVIKYRRYCTDANYKQQVLDQLEQFRTLFDQYVTSQVRYIAMAEKELDGDEEEDEEEDSEEDGGNFEPEEDMTEAEEQETEVEAEEVDE
jgi:hypothetical protein